MNQMLCSILSFASLKAMEQYISLKMQFSSNMEGSLNSSLISNIAAKLIQRGKIYLPATESILQLWETETIKEIILYASI